MEQKLRRWGWAVHSRLERHGVTVHQLRYFRPHRGQRRRSALYAQAEGVTRNANFFGPAYVNELRIRLMNLAYEALEPLRGTFGTDELGVDIHLSLNSNPVAGAPFGEPVARDESRDVTIDNDVTYRSLGNLIRHGTISPDSTFGVYRERYGLTRILKQGFHYISPDIISVRMMELLGPLYNVRSVLEIGAGVGVAAIAAKRLGIRDYTFLDSNAAVCEYVRRRFPWTTVIHGDALEFRFTRDYDLILSGIPYELNPELLRRQGAAMAEHGGRVSFQSSCMAFFEWEHDWLMGRPSMQGWPWYRSEQTVPDHFSTVIDGNMDWQRFILASNDSLESARLNLHEQGLLTPLCSSLAL